MEALHGAIQSQLDDAQAALRKITDDLGVAIGTNLTPAAIANLRLQQDVTQAIRVKLARSAEQISAAVGRPVLLHDAPLYPPTPYGLPPDPDRDPPGDAPDAPLPAAQSPLAAAGVLTPMATQTATTSPSSSASAPASVAQTSMLGPATPQVAGGDEGSPMALPWGGGGPSTGAATPAVAPQSATPATAAAPSNAGSPAADSGLPELEPCWQWTGPLLNPLGPYMPAACRGLTGEELMGCLERFDVVSPIYPCDATTGLPPVAPTPTPTPTRPPSMLGPPTTPPVPTPTTPTPPTPTPPVPTPTTPTPTVPTPTVPPYKQPPPPNCGPDETPVWNANAQYWTCEPTPHPLPPIPTPPPTPTPTPPTPTPTPPISLGGGGCGDRLDPCWVAANPPEKGYHALHVTPGISRALIDQTTIDISIPKPAVAWPDLAIRVVDLGDIPGACDIPYQLSLIDAGAGLDAFLGHPLDFNDLLNSSTKGKSWAEKLATVTVLLPIIVPIGLVVGVWQVVVRKCMSMITAASARLAQIAANDLTFSILNFCCLGALSKIGRIKDYINNFTYPVGLPSPAEAASAWLGNTIDECTFQAYVMANDVRYEPYKQVVMTQKLKFTPLEVFTLNKRGGLARGDLASRLRELGSLEQTDSQELNVLFNQIPGPGELIRFMQRDTENPNVVDTFKLDSGFGDNFQGLVKSWADMQGLSSDVALRYWRAHWEIPSPTQLYVMLHRLRHDPKWGGADKVTSDVVTALKQQDIPEYWIDRLMAVSYHALTRTDLFRAYEKGWIDDDAFINGMYQNGYSDTDAQTMLKFAANERNLAITQSHWFNQYAKGYLSSEQMHSYAEEQGYEGDVIADIDTLAASHRVYETQRLQIDRVVQQLQGCKIDQPTAISDLEDMGVPDELVSFWVTMSQLKSSCGTRREQAAALCSMLDQEIISASEYVDRMKLAKYDDISIQHYLQMCNNKIAAAAAKKEASKRKAAAQADAAQQRAADKAAKAEQQAASKAQRQTAAIARQVDAANKHLQAAASKLGQNLSGVDGPPAAAVNEMWLYLQTEMGLSGQDAAYVLSATATAAKGMTVAEWQDWVRSTAEARA